MGNSHSVFFSVSVKATRMEPYENYGYPIPLLSKKTAFLGKGV
jgi:hypothetical protein